MNPASEDIKTLLDGDSSLGLVFMVNLFISELPETPDNCVAVFDSPGLAPALHTEWKQPGVQIRIRGDKGAYRAAHLLAQTIGDLLHGIHNETVGATRYALIQQMGDVIPLGRDQLERPELSMNFQIQRTTA